MRLWEAASDVRKAVETIARLYRETGGLPPVLLEAYRETLAHSRRGMVQRFYEEMTELAPEALAFFSDVKPQR